MRPSALVAPLLVLVSLACGGTGEEVVDVVPEDEVPGEVVDTGAPEPAPQPRRRRRPAGPPAPKPVHPAPSQPGAPGEGAPEAPDEGGDGVAEGPDEDDGGAKRDPAPRPDGITQLSKTKWQVRRPLADRYKDDPYLLANNVQKSGDGWEVKGVRQKDAYHLGIRSKDVVLEVNGKKLKTDAQLLAAWLALKNKDAYDVLLVRNGQTRVHHYVIVD